MKKILTALVILMFLAVPAWAMQDDTAANEDNASVVIAIITSMIGGAIAVFTGWAKNRDIDSGEHEQFDFKHAWPTLLIGAVVGLVGYFMDIGPGGVVEMFEQAPFYGAAIFILEAGWKAVFRNTAPLIRDTIRAIKGGSDDSDPSPPPSAPSS